MLTPKEKLKLDMENIISNAQQIIGSLVDYDDDLNPKVPSNTTVTFDSTPDEDNLSTISLTIVDEEDSQPEIIECAE